MPRYLEQAFYQLSGRASDGRQELVGCTFKRPYLDLNVDELLSVVHSNN